MGDYTSLDYWRRHSQRRWVQQNDRKLIDRVYYGTSKQTEPLVVTNNFNAMADFVFFFLPDWLSMLLYIQNVAGMENANMLFVWC